MPRFRRLLLLWLALSLVFSSIYPLAGYSYALEPIPVPVPTPAVDSSTQTTTSVLDVNNNGELLLQDEALSKTFNRLEEGFSGIDLGLTSKNDDSFFDTQKIKQTQSVNNNEGGTKYTLDSGVIVETKYSTKNNVSLISGNKPIKQEITVTNPKNYDISVNLNINHDIDASDNKINWDGKEYQITNTPQVFKAYKGTAIINPKDEAYDEILGSFPGRETLPNITTPSYKGTSISFKTTNGNTGIYDFTDVANLDHEVTVQKQNNKVILTLTLRNIEVKANDTTLIDPNYDMATAGNYNLRYDGAAANDQLTNNAIKTADLDNDGKQDLLIGAHNAGNNSRSSSGSLYIIYNTLIDDYTGTGNNIDMATATNYNLRYDGAAASDQLTSQDQLSTADLDNNGKLDILVGTNFADNNSRSNSGSLYIIYSTLIDDYTGTGNNIDLATATNYNLRYDGAAASDMLAQPVAADLDNDGKQDILVGAYSASNNSRSTSGSLYVVYNTLIDDYSGTGNNIDLSTTTNYNLRYDGAAASDVLARNSITVGDLDNDSKKDILIGANSTDNNSRSNSGSLFVIYNTLIDDYTGTGNNIDLATATNYNLRYDGPSASAFLTAASSLRAVDLDNDSKQDLLIGAYGTANNSRTNSGSLFVIYNTLIDDYTGTGNNIDLATATNYNLRYDGAAASAFLTIPATADLDNDGKQDILVGAYGGANNDRAYSGSLFVIFSGLIDDYSGTGNNIDLATSANYSMRYDGAAASDYLVLRAINTGDLNNDGKQDILVGAYGTDNNSRSVSGSLYIIYNFPHAFSVNSISTTRQSIPTSITGTLSATNSTTSISGIEYSLNNTSYSGTWSTCTASDGSYNSTSESFSCSITGSTLAEGNHNIYLRTYDANTSYSVSSGYGVTPFIIDISNPKGVYTGSNGDNVTFSANSPGNNSYIDDTLPTFSFTKATDPNISKYQIILTNDLKGDDSWNNHTYIDNIDPNSPGGADGAGKASDTGKDSDRIREDNDRYIQYKDYQVTVRSKKDTDKLKSGAYKWKVRALDLAGNNIDTEERILKVKTKNSFFSKKDTSFPLSIQTLGNLNVNLASFNQSNIKPSYSINTTNPKIQGITYSGATIYLTLKNNTNNVTINKTTTAKDSRYTITLNNTDNLTPGEYTLKISSELNDNYIELPEFKLVLGKVKALTPQVKGVTASQSPIINTQPATIQPPVLEPTPIPTPLPTPGYTNINQSNKGSIFGIFSPLKRLFGL